MKPCDPTTHFMWTARLLRPLVKATPASSRSPQRLDAIRFIWKLNTPVLGSVRKMQGPDQTDGPMDRRQGSSNRRPLSSFLKCRGSRTSLMYMWPHMGAYGWAYGDRVALLIVASHTFSNWSATLTCEHQRRMRTFIKCPLWSLILNGK